jgi:P4 family phage/plasmid primase-like protien
MSRRRYNGNGAVQSIAEDDRRMPNQNQKGAVDAEAIASRVLQRRRFSYDLSIKDSFKSYKKEHWKWNGNIWKPINFERYCDDIIKLIPKGSRQVRVVEDVLKMMSFATQIVDPEEFKEQRAIRFAKDASIKIRVANGELIVALDGTIRLIDPNPKEFVTSYLPVEYDPKAECPTFDYLVQSCLPYGEDQELLQYYTGYCLLPDHRFQCMLFCYGPPCTGKSLLMYHGIGSLFGDLMSKVSLEDICALGEETKSFRHSLVNIGTEIDSRHLKQSSVFNQIVAGEAIYNSYKYETFSLLETATKLINNGNYLAFWERGLSDAQARRMRILTFIVDFSKEAKNGILEKKVKMEGNGIFNWALKGLVKCFSLREMPFGSKKSKVYYKQFVEQNNPLEAFVRKFCRFDRKGRILNEDFKSAFRYWCEGEGIKVGFAEPSRILKNKYPDRLRVGKIVKIKGRIMRCIEGLVFKDEGFNVLQHSKKPREWANG